jgi:hypothetical protein
VLGMIVMGTLGVYVGTGGNGDIGLAGREPG